MRLSWGILEELHTSVVSVSSNTRALPELQKPYVSRKCYLPKQLKSNMNIFTTMENKDKIENIEITHHNVLQHHIFLPPRMIGRICTF